MPNFAEPVSLTFIALSIGAIFSLVAVAILLVKKFK